MSGSPDTVGAAVDRDEGRACVDELLRNVEDTRDSLADSLSTLKSRLSPREMLASTTSSVRDGVRRAVNEAAREVRDGGERLTRAIQAQPGWAAVATTAAATAIWYLSREPRARSKSTALHAPRAARASRADVSTTAFLGSTVGILAALLVAPGEWERRVTARAQRSIRRALLRTVREGTEEAQRALVPAVSAILQRPR